MIQFLHPVSQAEPDLLANFPDAHAFSYQQFAGQRRPFLSSLAAVVRRAAILAIFIPAKTSVGDRFGDEVLQATQERIVLRDIDFPAKEFDGDQLRERAKERGGRAHRMITKGRT